MNSHEREGTQKRNETLAGNRAIAGVGRRCCFHQRRRMKWSHTHLDPDVNLDLNLEVAWGSSRKSIFSLSSSMLHRKKIYPNRAQSGSVLIFQVLVGVSGSGTIPDPEVLRNIPLIFNRRAYLDLFISQGVGVRLKIRKVLSTPQNFRRTDITLELLIQRRCSSTRNRSTQYACS